MPGFFHAFTFLTAFIKKWFFLEFNKPTKSQHSKKWKFDTGTTGFHAIHKRNEPSNSDWATCRPALFGEKIHIDYPCKGLLFILSDFAIDPILSLVSVEERRFLDLGDGTWIFQDVQNVTTSFSTSFMMPCFDSWSEMNCQPKIALLLLFKNEFQYKDW